MKAEANELVLSKVRVERRKLLASTNRTQGAMKDWIGVVTQMGTTGDGKAKISVRIPCESRVTVKTWNNAFSDSRDLTLINEESALYSVLMALKREAPIRFSGRLILDTKDTFREASLGERGSMTRPEFIFRFTEITPL